MVEEIPIFIVKIQEAEFTIREDLFRVDEQNIGYNVENQMGFNFEKNWVSFKIRVFYRYLSSANDIVMNIVVETIFHIEKLQDYVTGVTPESMNLPSHILTKFTEMGISHTRALLAKNKASSLYFNINLPYLDPIETAKRFFGNKITTSNELTPMEKLTQGYEGFIKGKELNTAGGKTFEKTLKKAAKPKPRGSK